MTGSLALDWALLAGSLFDTILLLWLGLTVLLTAERRALGRAWGQGLVGGGLLLGALFFVSHSAILAHDPAFTSRGLEFWWRVAWGPVLLLPLGWYLLMLWYAGFWDSARAAPSAPPGMSAGATQGLRARQRRWLVLPAACSALLGGLIFLAGALPAFPDLVLSGSGDQLAYLEWPGNPATPWLLLIYSVYVLLTTGLSLDAVSRPDPSARWMGDVGRRRARPWLVSASLALLLVSLMVAGGMTWIALYQHISRQVTLILIWFDLVIQGLVALAVLSLGQAIVRYEVFTGNSLRRYGFRRLWRNAIILAAGYGAALSAGFTLQLRPVYGLLGSTILLVVFYALLSWRTFVERDQAMQGLRPFVTGQHLTDQMLPQSVQTVHDIQGPFEALCAGLLGAESAYLIPLGPLAPLAGPARAYPAGRGCPPAWLSAQTAALLRSPQTICLPVEPAQAGGAEWAVPLWSARGLVGALLVGPKRDGGLYSQEEIEAARAASERLLDNQAGAEMGRRLIALQRQRLAESQVLDGRARRRLHDDVLPRLHAAMLAISTSLDREDAEGAEALSLLGAVHRQLSEMLQEMPGAAEPLLERLGIAGALQAVTEHELDGAFDEVTWEIEPGAEEAARALPPLIAEVVFCAAREALRNAARHARRVEGARPLRLCISLDGDRELKLVVEDNGVGFAPAESAAGSSPGPVSGRGLALHSTMMAVIGGNLEVESASQEFTRVSLRLPATGGQDSPAPLPAA